MMRGAKLGQCSKGENSGGKKVDTWEIWVSVFGDVLKFHEISSSGFFEFHSIFKFSTFLSNEHIYLSAEATLFSNFPFPLQSIKLPSKKNLQSIRLLVFLT